MPDCPKCYGRHHHDAFDRMPITTENGRAYQFWQAIKSFESAIRFGRMKKNAGNRMSGASSKVTFNNKKYGALFAHGVAHTISTDAENEAAIKELEAYSFAQNLIPEEEAYCDVLTTLIEQYERRYRLEITLDPVETLKVLMDNRGLKQADLVPAIDSKSHVSEILSGTRELSKAHIVKLSKFFRISPEVFFPGVPAR